jgi:hypothetical protein
MRRTSLCYAATGRRSSNSARCCPAEPPLIDGAVNVVKSSLEIFPEAYPAQLRYVS